MSIFSNNLNLEQLTSNSLDKQDCEPIAHKQSIEQNPINPDANPNRPNRSYVLLCGIVFYFPTS